MKVTLKQAKEIIAIHSDLLGAYYLLPDGNAMPVQEFRLLAHTAQKGKELTYSIIALLQNTDPTSNVQIYAPFESVIAQLEVPFETDKYWFE